jgi:hypothetical protein
VGIFVLTDIYKQTIIMTFIIPENIQKLIREFEQADINKIFNVGNIVTFFVKSGGVVHPIKLQIIDAPMDTGDQPKANLFFAKNLSPYPIDVRGAYFMITQPNQDIRTGSFDVLLIGKSGKDGFIPTKTKSRYTFKNIFKVDARTSGGKLIDSYFTNDHDAANDDTQSDDADQSMKRDFIEFIKDSQKGEAILLTLADNTTIKLDFIDIKGPVAQFEIDKGSELSPKYASLADSSIIEIGDDITVNEKAKTISVKGKSYHSENGEMVPTEISIDDIKAWDIADAAPDAESADDEEESVDTRKEAKAMMQAILNDPLMKKAFYRQPTLWNLLMSAIKGENPRGTGIGPAREIIDKYIDTKQIKNLGAQGENFKREKWARFKVILDSVIINPTGQPQDELRLSANEEYQAFVIKNKLGSDEPLTLVNKKRGYKIQIMRPYKEVPDAFEVTVIKSIENKTSGEIKDYKKTGIVQFISQIGSGYSKKETKKEPTKPGATDNTK